MIKNCQVCLAWNYTIEKSVQWRWISTKLSSLRILLSFKMQRATIWPHWPVLLDIVLQFEAFLPHKISEFLLISLKVVYPIIFVPNIFSNSRLIQKHIHIWQLFWKKQNDHKTRGSFKAYSRRIYNYFCWND